MSISETTDSTSDLSFANQQLAEIARSAEIRSQKSYWKSILYEVYSWLIIPFGSLAGVIIVLGFGYAATLLSLLLNLGVMVLWPDGFAGLYYVINIPLMLFAILYGNYLVYEQGIRFFFRTRRKAKRYRINNLRNLLTTTEDPILYLRSFSDDKSEELSRQTLKTYEEDLTFALGSLAPVIAIGQRFDDFSPLGATRIYLKDDEWQKNVRRLMQISKLIVLHAGTSKGLLWEIETLKKEADPRKIIISFLSWQGFDEEFRENEYKQFKKLVEHNINRSEDSFNVKFPVSIGAAKFMVFRNDWTPQLLKTSFRDELFYKFSTSLIIRETIRRILEERDLHLSYWRNIIYFTCMLWLIAGCAFQIGIVISSVIGTTYSSILFSVIKNTGVILGIPVLLLLFACYVAYFIVINWLLAKVVKSIRSCKEYILRSLGKIIPSRGSGLQKSIGLNDED